MPFAAASRCRSRTCRRSGPRRRRGEQLQRDRRVAAGSVRGLGGGGLQACGKPALPAREAARALLEHQRRPRRRGRLPPAAACAVASARRPPVRVRPQDARRGWSSVHAIGSDRVLRLITTIRRVVSVSVAGIRNGPTAVLAQDPSSLLPARSEPVTCRGVCSRHPRARRRAARRRPARWPARRAHRSRSRSPDALGVARTVCAGAAPHVTVGGVLSTFTVCAALPCCRPGRLHSALELDRGSLAGGGARWRCSSRRRSRCRRSSAQFQATVTSWSLQSERSRRAPRAGRRQVDHDRVLAARRADQVLRRDGERERARLRRGARRARPLRSG